MIFNLLVILALSVIVTFFAVANSATVSVNLIFWQTQQVSLAIVILVSTLFGVVFTGMIAFYQAVRDRWKIYQLEARLREIESAGKEDAPQQ